MQDHLQDPTGIIKATGPFIDGSEMMQGIHQVIREFGLAGQERLSTLRSAPPEGPFQGLETGR